MSKGIVLTTYSDDDGIIKRHEVWPACDQKTTPRCENPARHRFLWPGAEWSNICEPHHAWAVRVAETLGFRLQSEQLAPLNVVDLEPDNLATLHPEYLDVG